MREKGARFARDGWFYVITKGFERFLIVVLWCWEVTAGKCGRDYVSDH